MIEKCSSPIGDGNNTGFCKHSMENIEKCSSPIGDGNSNNALVRVSIVIEKCSSPIGDGNVQLIFVPLFSLPLRNVAPR